MTNSNTNNAVDEVITVEFNALVLNNNPTNQNNRGRELDNSAAFSEGGGASTDTSNTIHTYVYEPNVSVTKAATPTEGNPGDTITFTVQLANDNNFRGATAFDLNLVDALPPGYSNLTVVSTLAGATDNSSGTTLDIDIPSLAKNSSTTITYTAQLNNAIVPGETITNTVDLTYTSLPDDFGTTSNSTGSSLSALNSNQGGHTSGADDGERTGSGLNQNDYAASDSDSATVTGENIGLTKAIAATSESHTSGQNVAIGEVITYQVAVTLPETSLTGLIITDTLPAGLTIISDTISLYTLNAASVTFADVSGSVPGAAPGLSLPADATAAGSYHYNSGSGLLEINLGDVTNNDSDANIEQAIILYQAVVANVSGNDAGDTLANQASASVGTADPVTANAVSVTVQEPAVTVSKAINDTLSIPATTGPFDGGDTVVYDIVVSNPSGTNVSTAFDLTITDTIDSNLNLSNPISFVGVPATTNVTDNSDYTLAGGQAVDVAVDQLQPGESFTIRLTSTVQNSVTLGQVITNSANPTWTSLPGAQGTGSVTPGSSGDADGERNGSGGINDYSSSNSDSFTAGGTVDTVKSIAGTSESHTGDATADTAGDPRPVAVGEIITYRLATDLPELTAPNLVVTDTLPANIDFVAGSGRVSYSADNAFSGSGAFGSNETTPTTAITPTFDSGSRDLAFDIGQVINNDTDANAEQLIIEFEALVLDEAVNTSGAQWANSYRIDLDNDGTTEDSSNSVYAEIAQPELTVTKSRTDAGPVNVGDTVDTETFELTFTASATDADLPAQTLTYSLVSAPSGAAINSSSGLFSWTPTNAQGPGVYTFTVVVSDSDNLTDSQQIAVTVTDLDIDYSVAVDPTSLNEGNTGTQPITFTITRSRATDFASQVDYNFGGTAIFDDDYSGPTATVSFGADEISQTVVVDVIGDWIIEPDDTLSLTLADGTAPSGGLVSYITQSVTSTILNDDSAGITVISATTPLTISEPSGSVVFTIALTSQPTATVTIPLTNTTSECGLSAAVVALDSGNWQGVGVTVTAQDDVTTDGTQPCDITTGPTSSSDVNYAGLDPADVAVNVLDDDTPGVLISAASDDTTESGGTASFTVRLQTQPTDPVTITLQSSDLSEGQLGLSEVVFNSTTWNISQTVVITGVDDLIADGDQPYTIETGATQSSSLLYNNLPVADVALTNLDDDTPGVNAIPNMLTIFELNDSGVVSLTLTSQPTATVTINLSSGDTGICTLTPASLQIEPLTWSDPVSFTVNAVDNDEPSGDQSCLITGVVSSSDPVYDALADVEVEVTVEDDDVPPIFLPIIFNRFETQPDLIITDLQAGSDSVQVTIQNVGNEAVFDGFRIDLYFDPSRAPQYNDRWQDIAPAGVVWGISGSELPIGPGESRVLTLAEAIIVFEGKTISSSPPFPTGVPVYAQVDSVNAAGSFGGAEESDETNNVFGPVSSATGGSGISASGLRLIDPNRVLPQR